MKIVKWRKFQMEKKKLLIRSKFQKNRKIEVKNMKKIGWRVKELKNKINKKCNCNFLLYSV
jgi:hypothetical protein